MAIRRLIAAVLLAVPCYAGELSIGQFKGLNTNDTPATLADGESPALLNVDITPGGTSVKSRQGFGLYKTLTTSTSPVHGGHHFQDSNGNDIQIWCADSYQSIFNGLSPVQISTVAASATCQCADSQGFAYCINTNREIAIRTAGTVATTSFQQGIPLGTMLTFTPTRLAVSGVSGTPNTIYVSSANVFTTFTTGVTEFDPFTEVIASPGSRITHIRYACGKILWWKDQSFGYLIGDDQFSIENVIVTPDIGTLDNSSDEYNGVVYFRGQDNHIYQYDCSNVTRLSRSITPTISASSRRKSNSWTQTSQSDFASGFSIPTQNISTSLSQGDVIVSSFYYTNNVSSNITAGTELTNNSFESETGLGPFTGWTHTCGWAVGTSQSTTNCGTTSAQSGSNFLINTFGQSDSMAAIIDANTSVVISSINVNTDTEQCSWTIQTIPGSPANGQSVKVRISPNTAAPTSCAIISNAFTSGGNDVKFYYQDGAKGVGWYQAFDNFHNSPVLGISSITFTSSVFDTGFTSSIAQVQAEWNSNISTANFTLFHSVTSGGSYSAVLTSTGTNTWVNRYIRYSSTFSFPSSGLISSTQTVISKSSGVYYSAVNNAASLSSWGNFDLTDSVIGGSTVTYYVRASTNHFVLSATTVPWVAQTKNTTVSASTGTYFQMRADFVVSAATESPNFSNFTFNWYEGNAADKAYIQYFNDHVWVSVSSGTSGVNNQIQRWDLLNQTWLLDNIPSNGFVVDQGRLYIGSPSDGKVHLFGQGVYTDNAADIYSFWKSKDFVGSDPWVNNEYTASDFIFKQSSNTVTATYMVDTSTPTTRDLNLYDPVRSMVRRSIQLPTGKMGTFYSLTVSDTGSIPWEMMGHRVRYTPLPWKVQ